MRMTKVPTYFFIDNILFLFGLKNVNLSELHVWSHPPLFQTKATKTRKKEKGVPVELKTGKKIPHTPLVLSFTAKQGMANPQQLKAKSFHRTIKTNK